MVVAHHWVGVAEYHHCEMLNVLSLVLPYSVGVAAQLHQDHLMIAQELEEHQIWHCLLGYNLLELIHCCGTAVCTNKCLPCRAGVYGLVVEDNDLMEYCASAKLSALVL